MDFIEGPSSSRLPEHEEGGALVTGEGALPRPDLPDGIIAGDPDAGAAVHRTDETGRWNPAFGVCPQPGDPDFDPALAAEADQAAAEDFGNGNLVGLLPRATEPAPSESPIPPDTEPPVVPAAPQE